MLNLRRCVVGLVALLLVGGLASAQTPVTVVRGIPQLGIVEGGTERTSEVLPRARAVGLGVVISQIGDNYYWASRENTPLVAIDAGAFVTYFAVNGSGYVRVIKPGMKSAVSLLEPAAAQYDYVEHLLQSLHSITYYGTLTP
jgi:hypothetical protein